MYYPQAGQRPPQSGNTVERAGQGFQPHNYRHGGDFPAVDGSPNPWPGTAQPPYTTHPSMVQYVNQGHPRPPGPTSPHFAYSSGSESSYSQPLYNSDQQPRGIHSQSYYGQGEAAHNSQTSQQQYYLPNGHYQPGAQPSGLPGYPDPSIDPQNRHDSR